jgi:hypothetical protein
MQLYRGRRQCKKGELIHKKKSLRETEGERVIGRGGERRRHVGRKDGNRGKESKSILKKKFGISFLKTMKI